MQIDSVEIIRGLTNTDTVQILIKYTVRDKSGRDKITILEAQEEGGVYDSLIDLMDKVKAEVEYQNETEH